MVHKVQVWLFRGDGSDSLEALLLRTTAERGAFWQPVTGSVEPGESTAAAAARELAEETGVHVPESQVLPVGHFFEYESRWGGRAHEEVFAVRAPAEVAVAIDRNEHDAFQWVDLRQAKFFLKHEETKKCLQIAVHLIEKNFSLGEN